LHGGGWLPTPLPFVEKAKFDRKTRVLSLQKYILASPAQATKSKPPSLTRKWPRNPH